VLLVAAEKLRRATSMPARMTLSASNESLVGAMVQTIGSSIEH
jgi:hypothetical protein